MQSHTSYLTALTKREAEETLAAAAAALGATVRNNTIDGCWDGGVRSQARWHPDLS